MKPDRATELDDDVPTYDPQAQSPAVSGDATTDVYARAGRAAPKRITPEDFTNAEIDAATEVFPQSPPEQLTNPGDTLISDAPVTAYDDADFAKPMVPVAPVPEPQEEPVVVVEEEPVVVEAVAVEPKDKRGTIDLGLLVLRIGFATFLIGDAIRAFFLNGGVKELAQEFSGYATPDLLSVAIPAMELFAGVFLLFGLVTPVAAAIATVSTTFMALHETNRVENINWTNLPDTMILGFMLVVIALALQFTGPGVFSFDISRSWVKRPLISSWIFALIGIGGACALWWFGAATNPFN
ncbi:DoxX [Corynebacterium felinum]|nr:DoxX family protein [Corynebacterium felinum]WJY94735.1 DoxX [Corynebacterium felinum]